MVKSGQWQCFQNCHCPLSFVIVFRWLTIDLRLATDLPSLHCISPCLINFQLITILSTLSTVVVHYCPYWHTKYTFQCQCLPWWLCSLPPMQLAVLVCDQWSSALPTAGKCNSRTWHCIIFLHFINNTNVYPQWPSQDGSWVSEYEQTDCFHKLPPHYLFPLDITKTVHTHTFNCTETLTQTDKRILHKEPKKNKISLFAIPFFIQSH